MAQRARKGRGWRVRAGHCRCQPRRLRAARGKITPIFTPKPGWRCKRAARSLLPVAGSAPRSWRYSKYS
eukprot:12698259-Heterocapsa_arctica.AAC.1